MTRITLFVFASVLISAVHATAALAPDDVVVVYNSNIAWNTGQRQSKAVADYYCQQRGVASSNEFAVDWALTDESIPPDSFCSRILNDRYDWQNNLIKGLKTQLAERAGLSAGQIPDPATDPTKCIVLCYGIPLKIEGNERECSVDSALTLLFNKTDWGRTPIGSYCSGALTNPYYSPASTNPLDRGGKPTDFGEFRANETLNDISVAAPIFTIIRAFDDTHAIAAGTGGVLYTGTRTGNSWDWNPVDDSSKSFVAATINDISVFDSSHAWACTAFGSVIATNNGGENWTVVRNGTCDPDSNDCVTGVSLYSQTSGWYVGSTYHLSGSMAYFINQDNSIKWKSNDPTGGLPGTFVPSFISAASATEAWVSGNGGIYHTTDGTNWTQQYTSGVNRIWVSNGDGWAITTNGHILRTVDSGANWTLLSSPTTSSGADLAVSSSSRLAIAGGSTQFLTLVGTTWTSNTASSSVSSVTWAGSANIAAAGASTLTWASGTPGSFTWSSETKALSTNHWKMRYLVTRLDGYSYPLDDNCTNPQGIPLDVRNMIDKAVTADGDGRTEALTGNWVLDSCPGHTEWKFTTSYVNSLMSTLGIPGSQILTDPSQEDWEANGYDWSTDHFVRGTADVICDSFAGSYEFAGYSSAVWWRQGNTYKPGAVALASGVSGDARTLRFPSWFIVMTPDDDATPVQNTLKVYMWPGQGADKLDNTDGYFTFNCGLYSGYVLTLHAGTETRTATFSSTEAITHGDDNHTYTITVPVAGVSLSGLSGNAYFTISCPSSDPLHPGEIIGASDSYTISSTGITYTANISQSLSSELIREGATATTGNVSEPGAASAPNPHIIFAQYTAGNTFAESAYMGFANLSWMEVAVGDPLMAPFFHTPSIHFEDSFPKADAHVAGYVTLCAHAIPGTAGPLVKVEFRATCGASSKLIQSVSRSVDGYFTYAWDTTEMSGDDPLWPDGSYTIEAIGYRASQTVSDASDSHDVVVDNASVGPVAITQPADHHQVTEHDPVTAYSASNEPLVQYWLLGAGVPILAGDSSDSSEGYPCIITASIAPAIYRLQAVACNDSTPVSRSYSEPITINVGNVGLVVSGGGDLASRTDQSEVILMNVIATTSSDHDGTFYVESPDRAYGIRVISNDVTVQAGTVVDIRGILHKAGDITERYIEALPLIGVWFGGSCSLPAPLGMPGKSIGGNPPADNVGLTHAPIGLYNTGLLVRTWGRVTYVGSDFAYIDDGSGLADGNDLPTLTVVPPNSGDTQTWSATGVRVYFGSLPKPGLGDYVAVTGVSSLETVGENRVRMIRVPDASCLTCNRGPYRDGYLFEDLFCVSYDGHDYVVPQGQPLRLRNQYVACWYQSNCVLTPDVLLKEPDVLLKGSYVYLSAPYNV